MPSTDDEVNLKLGTRDWIWIISLIIASMSANLGIYYQSNRSLYDRIDILDDKWQERLLTVARDIKTDLRRMEDNNPPVWLVNVLNEAKTEISSLKERVRTLETRKP